MLNNITIINTSAIDVPMSMTTTRRDTFDQTKDNFVVVPMTSTTTTTKRSWNNNNNQKLTVSNYKQQQQKHLIVFFEEIFREKKMKNFNRFHYIQTKFTHFTQFTHTQLAIVLIDILYIFTFFNHWQLILAIKTTMDTRYNAWQSCCCCFYGSSIE